MFGTFIKEIRSRSRTGLREFCLKHGHDPSNWSKVERGILPPPRDEQILKKWAAQLCIKPGTDDWIQFFDFAAVDAGRIPDYIMQEKDLVSKLPVFFRTLSGKKPSEGDLKKMVKLLTEADRP
jgi:hypothetical protein